MSVDRSTIVPDEYEHEELLPFLLPPIHGVTVKDRRSINTKVREMYATYLEQKEEEGGCRKFFDFMRQAAAQSPLWQAVMMKQDQISEQTRSPAMKELFTGADIVIDQQRSNTRSSAITIIGLMIGAMATYQYLNVKYPPRGQQAQQTHPYAGTIWQDQPKDDKIFFDESRADSPWHTLQQPPAHSFRQMGVDR